MISLYERGKIPVRLRDPAAFAFGSTALLSEPPKPRVEWYGRYVDSFRLPRNRHYGDVP